MRVILDSRQTVELQSCSLHAGFDCKCVYLNLSRRVPWFGELRRVGAESNTACPEVSFPLITLKWFLGYFVWAVKYKNIAGLSCYSNFRLSAVVYCSALLFLGLWPNSFNQQYARSPNAHPTKAFLPMNNSQTAALPPVSQTHQRFHSLQDAFSYSGYAFH